LTQWLYITTIMKETKINNDELLKIFTGLAQVTRCCRQDEAFCENVTFNQFLILDAVARNRELNISDLHELLAVEKSTTTRLLTPLIRKGLVNRNKDQRDFRAARLTLTKEGENTYKNVRLCLDIFLQRVMSNIPVNKRNDLLDAVKYFIQAIKNSAADGTSCNCK
jgi:DNA-binding MarR family transcriptional regulator